MNCARIALLASEYPPFVFGGLGTHVHALTAALARRGTSVTLFVPGREQAYEPVPLGVELRQVPIGPASTSEEFWLRFGGNVSEIVDQAGNEFDVIHCHDWMTVLAGIRLRGLLKAPLVFSVHLPQVTSPNLAMENLGLAWADCVLVNSRAVAREIAHRELPIRSLRVIPNGVDLARFVPAESLSEDRYVLFVGRLVAQKGVEVALSAFDVLLSRCPDVRFVVAGDGEQELYLQRLARHLGISSQVDFVGWQRGEALVTLYQGAEVVVVPSHYEPFGLVALEAMACGRAVVASKTGGLAEVVEHGVTGFLVPPGDHLELARRLATLLLDPARRAQFGVAARQHAARFGWEKIAVDTERVYEKLRNEALTPPLGEAAGLIDDFIRVADPALLPLVECLVPDPPPSSMEPSATKGEVNTC